MKRPLIIVHFIALLMGGMIYILFRSSTLKMFKWYETIGLGEIIMEARKLVDGFTGIIPDWILFSLPDGLWVFSYVCIMLFIWGNTICKFKFVWILIVPFLAIGSEIGQLFNYVSGVFDPTDVIFYILGMTLPFIFFYKINNLTSSS